MLMNTQVVLITGGLTGIGRAPAVAFAKTDRIRKKAGVADRRKDVGEDTVFEAVKNEYVGPGPYVFLFEDEKMLRQVGVTLFDKYPVHKMTTFAWLVALERRSIIPDADAVFADSRGLSAPLVPRDAPPRPGVRKTLID
jgi:hypothetical protein